VISTDPDDALVASAAAIVGSDHVMWASDFPHPDALYPDAVSSFLGEAKETGLGGDDLAAVLWDTAVRFYGLDIPERSSKDGAPMDSSVQPPEAAAR
jgi:predicted TIM-barrel fold metal-dependent hydrolase